MNKFLKFAVALALLLAVVIVAQGGAWAAKVNSADSAPVAAVDGAGVAVARPAGTVVHSIKSVKAGGGVATVKKNGLAPADAPNGTYYKAACPNGSFTLSFAAGPNWAYGVYVYDGANWSRLNPNGPDTDGNYSVDVACDGSVSFVIGSAN